MKKIILTLISLAFLGCGQKKEAAIDLELVKKEVIKAEEDFKNMAQTKRKEEKAEEAASKKAKQDELNRQKEIEAEKEADSKKKDK